MRNDIPKATAGLEVTIGAARRAGRISDSSEALLSALTATAEYLDYAVLARSFTPAQMAPLVREYRALLTAAGFVPQQQAPMGDPLEALLAQGPDSA
jgi:hypothetical protein